MRTAARPNARPSASRSLEVVQDLRRGPLARFDAALHVALEVLRRVLAGEVAVEAPLLLRAREARVLADLPVRVGAPRPLVARPVVACRKPVPPRDRPGQHGLDL